MEQIGMNLRSWESLWNPKEDIISQFLPLDRETDNEEKFSAVCSSAIRSVGVCHASNNKTEDTCAEFLEENYGEGK